MSDGARPAHEARFAGSSVGGGPRDIALYGGATETDQFKIPYRWLEFYDWGISLRGRGLIARLVATRNIRYQQITQLIVLIATTGPHSRGIRIRTTAGSESVYFFTRPAAVPLLVERFSRHDVGVDGQLTRTRIPSSLGYIYRENAPIE
jgi:hypothetical protein